MSFATALATLSIAISVSSLGASLYTLWVVHLRRGSLRMTQPVMLFLGRDQGPSTPKLWLRTLLFSTSARGQIIENLFLRVHAPVAGPYMFDFWVYGEKGHLSRGSGLFVGQTGVVHDNHFMQRRGTTDFLFWSGDYRVEVFAGVLGKQHPERLMEVRFTVDGEQAAKMVQLQDAGMFFDWDPEARTYSGHLESRTANNLEVWKRFGQNF
jgi:hypothetical protein